MKALNFLVFSVLLFMAGCAFLQPPVPYQLALTVVDADGNPLEGAIIDYSFKPLWGNVTRTNCITKSDGKFPEILHPQYLKKYVENFNYKASKDGYYSKSGKFDKIALYRDVEPVKEETITIARPIDYFNKNFVSTVSEAKLKTKILSFIDLIILQGIVSESELEPRSICLVPFKGNSYLQFKFTNTNVYNSLKLNKYDIGKLMFDEVIRKVLTPLNEYVAESNLFYGYDLTVVGHTKSFLDKYATAETIEYRFMIPEKIVRQYKNKDISGQQVLDASVILMDDERIELKLQ